jgi:hypothetical protein
MTVFFDKARTRWRYDFQLYDVRHARECMAPDGSRATSRRAATEIEAEAKRMARMAPKQPRSADLTLAQVMNDLTEIWQKKRGWSDRKRMVREILEFFGPATCMRDIDGARIQDYIAFAQTQPLRVWNSGPSESAGKGSWKQHPSGAARGAATVNRYLPVLRAAFKRAYHPGRHHQRRGRSAKAGPT